MTNETKLPDEDGLLEAMARAIYDDPNEDFDCGAIANIALDAIRPTLAALQGRAEAVEAENKWLREALGEIGRQKKTNELETEYDVEMADWEGGFDLCVDRARAALGDMP